MLNKIKTTFIAMINFKHGTNCYYIIIIKNNFMKLQLLFRN